MYAGCQEEIIFDAKNKCRVLKGTHHVVETAHPLKKQYIDMPGLFL